MKANRQMALLAILQRDRTAEIGKLSDELLASRITIRRDLREMERQGLLRVTRGGAILNQGATYEPGYLAKTGQERAEKLRIAREAAELVSPGDTVLLDAGTTTAALARELVRVRDVTVISNSLTIANVLAPQRSVRFIMVGGVFRDVSAAFLGPFAEDAIRNLRVDRAFIATEAVDVERGLQVPDDRDASIKRAMVEAAREVVVVADHTKFGLQRLHTFAPWAVIHRLVTGSEVDPQTIEHIRQRGVTVTIA
jgi:DeoR family fructose operon transcriptional repressor